MAGLNPNTPYPTEIVLHQTLRQLEVHFSDDRHYFYPCEFLRVLSPSAEVRGHGIGQAVLQTGKRNVTITALEPVGNYALKIIFSDGHDSGLYSWEYLLELGAQQEALWQEYLQQLATAGASRD